MLKPINVGRYLKKNYSIMLEDYNQFLFSITFIILPVLFSILVMYFIDSESISSIIGNSISFFSIIVGFLINLLVLLLGKSKIKSKDKLNLDIEKLRKHLSFNILNSIIFGVGLVVLILFYGNFDLIITIKDISINLAEFVLLFLFFHVIMLILNIIRKFGVYVETRFANWGLR